jgi:hypothetical protein
MKFCGTRSTDSLLGGGGREREREAHRQTGTTEHLDPISLLYFPKKGKQAKSELEGGFLSHLILTV